MSPRQKLLRECSRLFRPGHWWTQIRFWIPVLQARLIRPPAHTDLRAYLPHMSPQTHLICFVAYAPNGLRADTRTFLTLLCQQPEIELVLIANHTLSPEDRQFLSEIGAHAIQGHNRGYDFGAYRDFFLSVFDLQTPCQRLTLMNDSFVAFPGDTLLRLLSPPEDVLFWGVTEQGERKKSKRHIGSFFLNFDGKLLENLELQGFWRQYKPMGSRSYTIKAGETFLTQCLLRAGVPASVHYDKSHLLARLPSCDRSTLSSVAALLHASEVFNAAELKGLEALDLQAQRIRIEEAIKTTENLRLSGVYTYLCGMPLIKRRDLRAYPKLRNWYQKTYQIPSEVL